MVPKIGPLLVFMRQYVPLNRYCIAVIICMLKLVGSSGDYVNFWFEYLDYFTFIVYSQRFMEFLFTLSDFVNISPQLGHIVRLSSYILCQNLCAQLGHIVRPSTYILCQNLHVHIGGHFSHTYRIFTHKSTININYELK